MLIQCYCKGISRGTTPTLAFGMNVPILGTEQFDIAFKQKGIMIVNKLDNEIIRVDKDSIKIKLSQEETLLFSSKFPIEVQIRTKYRDGAATASNIIEIYLEDILKEGKI